MMMWSAGARIVLSAFALCSMATAQSPDADRVSNIERAAAEIAAIQKKSGADGAFAAINGCYKRELTHATAVTHRLEVCLAQDIIVSQISAAVYARLSPEARRMGGAPEPEAVSKAMTQRVTGVFARFKVPEQDALAFNKIVQMQGLAAYGQTSFPNQFPAKGK